jgi:ribose/xylose/arabinose/galactoside ABC-type transport system permease subunit
LRIAAGLGDPVRYSPELNGAVPATLTTCRKGSMVDVKNAIWPLPWVVKLVLTTLAGGMLGIGTYFFVTYAMPIAGLHSLFCWVSSLFWTTAVGSSLYLLERNGWRASFIKGFVLGVIGWTVITFAIFVFVFWAVQNSH